VNTVTPDRASRRSVATNWVLALLTIPGAAVAMFFAYGAVLGTSACAQTCEHLPNEAVYTVMLYGPPVVAVLAVVLSFFTARLSRGYLVPAAAWALLILDVAVMFFAFRQS
jgi:hypothetical protein